MKKRNRKTFWVIVIVLTILLSNVLSPFINILADGLFKWYHFETKNKEFVFSALPSKGRDFDMMERQFEKFLRENPQTNDTIIFRTFSRNPLRFWNWYDYLTDEVYDYEYKR